MTVLFWQRSSFILHPCALLHPFLHPSCTPLAPLLHPSCTPLTSCEPDSSHLMPVKCRRIYASHGAKSSVPRHRDSATTGDAWRENLHIGHRIRTEPSWWSCHCCQHWLQNTWPGANFSIYSIASRSKHTTRSIEQILFGVTDRTLAPFVLFNKCSF